MSSQTHLRESSLVYIANALVMSTQFKLCESLYGVGWGVIGVCFIYTRALPFFCYNMWESGNLPPHRLLCRPHAWHRSDTNTHTLPSVTGLCWRPEVGHGYVDYRLILDVHAVWLASSFLSQSWGVGGLLRPAELPHPCPDSRQKGSSTAISEQPRPSLHQITVEQDQFLNVFIWSLLLHGCSGGGENQDALKAAETSDFIFLALGGLTLHQPFRLCRNSFLRAEAKEKRQGGQVPL